MSTASAQQFGIDMFTKTDLMKKLETVSTVEDLDKVIASEGYDFSDSELKDALANLSGESIIDPQRKQLSDDQLDTVAGGGAFGDAWGGMKKVARGIAAPIRRKIHGENEDESRDACDEVMKRMEDKVPSSVKDVIHGLDDIITFWK